VIFSDFLSDFLWMEGFKALGGFA